MIRHLAPREENYLSHDVQLELPSKQVRRRRLKGKGLGKVQNKYWREKLRGFFKSPVPPDIDALFVGKIPNT